MGPGATVSVAVAGRGGVPATGVTAVALNVTVTRPTADGYLTIYPSGTSLPLAANLNFTPAKTVPNLVVVKLGTDGRVDMFNSAGATEVIYDVAGWYSDDPTGNDGRLQPLAPARILDTRTGIGGFSAPVGPGATVSVAVAGRGGVPATGATAVAINVTVTQPTGDGHLTLYPSDSVLPLAANLNFTPNKTVPNLVVVKLGANGRVDMFNSAGATEVIVDVAGWFSDDPTGNDGRFQPLTPARILDTRFGPGSPLVRLGPGASLDLQVTGLGGVPATGAGAVVLNVAVTNTTATSYLTVFPTGEALPLAANLNWVAGDTVSNRIIVKLGTSGRVTLFNHSGDTDVIVDTNGWFTDASQVGTAGVYVPLNPARILETRVPFGGSGPIAAGATLDVQVTGRGGVPASGVSAVVLNATVVSPAGVGFFTIFPAGSLRPLASDLNYAPAETRPNLVVVKLGAGGKVSLFTSVGAEAVFDVAGYITTEAPTPAVVSTYAYDGDGLRTSKTVAGVTTSFTWEASSGMPRLIDDGTNFYLYGPDGSPLSHIDRSNVVTWYHHDQLGSTRVLSNNAGARVATATYDPYGRATASTGALSPLGFAGEYTDAETGFVYLRARYYDPATAQFITRDPLGPAAGHPYAYAAGNPLNLTDPSGLCPMCLPVLAGFLIGAGTDIAMQLAFQAMSGCGVSLGNINWTQVAVSGVFGGLSQGRSAMRAAPNTAGKIGLSLRYKPGWTGAQRAAADAKVAALNEADLVVTPVQRSGTSAAARYRRAGGEIPSAHDVDHVIDLQLGGADDILNMNPLDFSVNRSLGAQIGCRISALPVGTRVTGVSIC
ncbi:MAG: RHS repeat-associated core domain-containing protein [Acidimicrobiales bacterium]